MNGIIPFQIQSLWEMLKIWEKCKIEAIKIGKYRIIYEINQERMDP